MKSQHRTNLKALKSCENLDHEAADRLYVGFGGLNKNADP